MSDVKSRFVQRALTDVGRLECDWDPLRQMDMAAVNGYVRDDLFEESRELSSA